MTRRSRIDPRPVGAPRRSADQDRPRASSVAVLLLAALLLVAGCTAEAVPPEGVGDPPPFAACTALTAPPAGAATPGAPAPGTDAAAAPSSGTATDGAALPAVLPDLDLPCFTGGESVSLRALRGPAVINLWASWCQPCRKELPAFQRLVKRSGGDLHVIGVDTRDGRAAARSTAEDLGLTFPNLFDPDEELRRALDRPFVPMTLFVDDGGRIRHLDASGALDDAALAALVERHLGVVVAP